MLCKLQTHVLVTLRLITSTTMVSRSQTGHRCFYQARLPSIFSLPSTLRWSISPSSYMCFMNFDTSGLILCRIFRVFTGSLLFTILSNRNVQMIFLSQIKNCRVWLQLLMITYRMSRHKTSWFFRKKWYRSKFTHHTCSFEDTNLLVANLVMSQLVRLGYLNKGIYMTTKRIIQSWQIKP